MHTKNGVFAKLSLLRELTQFYASSWHQEQEVVDLLYTSQKEIFVLILPQVSLGTRGDDNRVQKSHLQHKGEKTHQVNHSKSADTINHWPGTTL